MRLQVAPRNITLHGRDTQVFQAAGAAGAVTWSIEPYSEHIDGVYTAPICPARGSLPDAATDVAGQRPATRMSHPACAA